MIGAAALAAFSWPAAGQGQPPCLAYDKLVDMLEGKYDERPVAQGLGANGYLIQVFASPDGATWTAIYVTPGGVACVSSVGEDWQTVKPKPNAT